MRERGHSIRPLVVTTAVLLGLSLLPLNWLRWVGDLADILAVPLAPLNDAGGAVASWLRPPERTAGRRVEDAALGDPEALDALRTDRDTYRALWHAERLRNEDLLERIADLRLADEFHRGSVFEPVQAEIIGRSAEGLRGPVRLNAGRRAGVATGDVGVHRGAHLVGRVVGEVDALTCLMLPITDPANGRLSAAVPREPEPSQTTPPAIRLLLTPEGDGAFTADTAADAGVRLGEQVVLDDPTWPDTARGMIVGQVESLEPREDQPLRVRLRVRPVFELHELRRVMLKTQPRRNDAASEGGLP